VGKEHSGGGGGRGQEAGIRRAGGEEIRRMESGARGWVRWVVVGEGEVRKGRGKGREENVWIEGKSDRESRVFKGNGEEGGKHRSMSQERG